MKILITGAGSLTGQSIYKALTMYNFNEKIEIHFGNSDSLAAGIYFNHQRYPIVAKPIFPLAVDSNYTDFLKAYIESNDISLVFSGTQHELNKIALLRDTTLKIATIPYKIVQICIDKFETFQILEKYDIRIPRTYVLKQYLEEETFTGPVIVKPKIGSSSRNILKFKNKESAVKCISNVNYNLNDFIAQEFLEGDEMTCGCYIDRYSRRVSTIIFRRFLTPDGATAYGELVANQEIEYYLKKVVHTLILEGLDFGHINVQMMVDEKGPCLFEINGRLSSTEAPKAYYGFNSCAAYIANIVQKREFSEWVAHSNGKFIRYYEELYF